MWDYVDKQLLKYYRKHRDVDKELEYRIQNVFNMGFEFSSLYQYANSNVLRQFKTRINMFKEKYNKNDYVSYLVNKYKNRTLIKNNEILRVMLLMEYAEVYQKNYNNQLALFDEISEHVTEIAIQEVKPLLKGRKKRHFKRHPYVYEHMALLHFLAMPNNLGVAWDEHIASIIDYNSDQVYKKAVIDLRNNDLKVDKKLIENQTKREINYKPTSNNKFSGQIDNEISFIINETKKQVYKYYGIKKVIIKGVLDERTCEVCEQYIGKIYNIGDIVVGEQIGSHINCRCFLETCNF